MSGNDIRDMFVDTAGRMLKDVCTKELLEAADHGEWASQLWSMLEESGMNLVPVPEEADGVGGSFADALAIVREAGRFAPPVPLAETLLANWLLSLVGLPVVTGPATVAPVSRQESVVLKRVDGGWELSGTAQYVPWARQVSSLIVVGDAPEGTAVAVVDPARCVIQEGNNLANEARDTVRFDGVKVPEEAVAMAPAHVTKDDVYVRGALMRAALMAGALDRVLELSVQYAQERIQFGRPIARFQAIQQQLAVLAGEVIAANTAVESAMALVERSDQERCSEARTAEHMGSMMAKITTGQAVQTATAIAHQVHGAIGFTDEHLLHYLTRRLWSWRDEFGSETEWAEKLGQQVLNAQKELWPLVTSI